MPWELSSLMSLITLYDCSIDVTTILTCMVLHLLDKPKKLCPSFPIEFQEKYQKICRFLWLPTANVKMSVFPSRTERRHGSYKDTQRGDWFSKSLHAVKSVKEAVGCLCWYRPHILYTLYVTEALVSDVCGVFLTAVIVCSWSVSLPHNRLRAAPAL